MFSGIKPMTFLLYLLSLLLAQQPGQPTSGTISGQIRDVNGAPAAGIRVAATPAETDVAGLSAGALLISISKTDNEGRYRLEDIPPGRYLIVAGLLSSPSFYPGVTTLDQGSVV